MVYLGIFSSLLAIDISRDVLGAYAHSTNHISASNQHLTDIVKSETDAKNLLNQLEGIKKELLSVGNAKSGHITTTDGQIDYDAIPRKSSKVPYHELAKFGLKDFNQQFDNYCQNIKMTKMNRRLVDEINTYRLGENENSTPIIGQLPLIGMLNILTDWQNKILLIEYTKSM